MQQWLHPDTLCSSVAANTMPVQGVAITWSILVVVEYVSIPQL